ncbi:DNA polymerase III, delta subunit [Sporobacter termitidis DSM 10068]|uniref:DNA polymerase III, delta subunit n=1 Tax=Sporobacter termitidis DSM 10068 TaxID=1123282 RepID=A0A1M5Z7N5_9FIRM|nr:hypothetical protein [Sporobacter termitidis]SHI19903.1 DNA polymerase III, delta subunit [Sporobacter termitidis DSM 10068]
MERYDKSTDTERRGGGYSHASIVWGGDEDARNDFAYRMARAIVCGAAGTEPCGHCAHCDKSSRHSHPDIILIDRPEDARNIQVDQIRALKEDAIVMPNEASAKAYIIRHADAMNVQAQNAVLKLLEEPPESAKFILVAENHTALLPTVRSRCVELPCERADTARETDKTVAAFYEALAEGGLKMSAFCFVLEKLDKGGFIDFIGGACALLEEKLREAVRGGGSLTPEYLMRAVGVLNRAKEYFDGNVGLVHIAGLICAELTVRNEENND